MIGSEQFIARLRADFPGLTELQESRFRALDGLYREWNARINVISRKDIDNLYEHHILHSLAIAKYLQISSLEERFASSTVLDLGTGGGFPGIPLAIMYPGARFTLCDSVGKKTRVAGEVARALSLDNVDVVNARAESFPGSFDFVVSRAVASLVDFYPWVKGRFNERILYLKGGDVNEEIASVMSRHHMKKGSVSVWKVSSWLGEEWFDGKLLIDISRP